MNPIWDERFELDLGDEPETKQLRIDVWDWDRFGSGLSHLVLPLATMHLIPFLLLLPDDFLGYATLPVDGLVRLEEATMWVALVSVYSIRSPPECDVYYE